MALDWLCKEKIINKNNSKNGNNYINYLIIFLVIVVIVFIIIGIIFFFIGFTTKPAEFSFFFCLLLILFIPLYIFLSKKK